MSEIGSTLSETQRVGVSVEQVINLFTGEHSKDLTERHVHALGERIQTYRRIMLIYTLRSNFMEH